jgi:L-serine dehydratase
VHLAAQDQANKNTAVPSKGKTAMKPISILNDVLGPIMRGPSSSHTAGSFHIGALARALLGDEPAIVTFAFDPDGSLAQVYSQQGSDLGFVAGVMGWSITDERFPQALDLAIEQGLEADFVIRQLPGADHPNTVEIQMTSQSGRQLCVVAKSIGGGAVVFTQVAGWPVHLTGDAHEVLVELEESAESTTRQLLTQDALATDQLSHQDRDGRVLLHAQHRSPIAADVLAEIERLPGVHALWTVSPIFFVQPGEPLFSSAAEMVALAEERNCSLGRIALAYEATLLGVSTQEVLDETIRRFDVMRSAVNCGLEEDPPSMQLLHPSAHKIYQAEAEGRLAIGGIHARTAARAMAVMHVNGGMGVVCAAPTAGSAGVLPGVAVTLAEEQGLSDEQTALALLAASAVGLILATRATFAAEVAGCQVEISAAGAMGAAAVVEAAGGSPRQAVDAAAISFQNTMGLICDLVQGIVEIPCHTRNAAAASGAFVCADLILGGYVNPIPLDETIDAVYAVGQMLPRELKCTALGGISQAPSALAMPCLR